MLLIADIQGMGQKNIFQTSRLESASATGFIRGFYMMIFLPDSNVIIYMKQLGQERIFLRRGVRLV